jgi:SAM-dependent methyltransferase
MPCLGDYDQEGGSVKSEYFWQDLLVAQKIFRANPKTHVDIGSRIDSFVAHVASFREIEVFDIRAVTSRIPGVRFKKADFMNSASLNDDYCDSLSCLHALEHFGLGRYGDALDKDGYRRGLENMARILRADGTFYLSVPLGLERVEFNAHRIFDPFKIYQAAEDMKLKLYEFSWVDGENVIHQSVDFLGDMNYLKTQNYNLGIFIFKKIA